MGREIKFRAWDNFHQKMWSWEQCNAFSTEPGGIKRWFDDQDLFQMQWTGLVDKNGVEIYEGDICKFDTIKFESYEAEHGLVGAVNYSHGQLVFDKTWGFFVVRSSVEVIGNIYENPELL